VKRHAIVFLISDCLDADFDTPLAIAAQKHELTVIRISDPSENDLPDAGLTYLRDPETNQVVLMNFRNKKLREKWRSHQIAQHAYLNGLLNRTGVDLVEVETNGSVSEPLIRLFEKRRVRR
jgi:uncharacterized protein (DUF58 family)